MRFNKCTATDQQKQEENIFKKFDFDITNDSVVDSNNKQILIDACETTSKIIDEKIQELKQQTGLLCRVFRRESANKKNHINPKTALPNDYQTMPPLSIEMNSNLDIKSPKLSSTEYTYTERVKTSGSGKEILEEKCLLKRSSWNNDETSKIFLPPTGNSKRYKPKLMMTTNNRHHDYHKQQETRPTRSRSWYEETFERPSMITASKKKNYSVIPNSNTKKGNLFLMTLDKNNVPHQSPSSSSIDTLRSSCSTIKTRNSSLDNSDFISDSPDLSSSSIITNTNTDLRNDTIKHLTTRRSLSTSNSHRPEQRYIDLPKNLIKSTHSRRQPSQQEQFDLKRDSLLLQQNSNDYHQKRSRSYYSKNDDDDGGGGEQFIISDQQQNRKGHEQQSSSSLNQYTNRIMSIPKVLSPTSNHHPQTINSSSMLSQISSPLSDLIVGEKRNFVPGLNTTHQTESTHLKDLVDTSKSTTIAPPLLSNKIKQLTGDESISRKKTVHFDGHLTTEIQPLPYSFHSKISENKKSCRKMIEKSPLSPVQTVKDDDDDVFVDVLQYKINHDDEKVYKNEKVSSNNIIAGLSQPSSLNNIEKTNKFFVSFSSPSPSSSSSTLKQKEKNNIILTEGVVENEITSAAVSTPPITMTTNNSSFFSSSSFFPILSSTTLSSTTQQRQKGKDVDEQKNNNVVNDVYLKRFPSYDSYDVNCRLKSKHQHLFDQKTSNSSNSYREQPNDQIKSSSIQIQQPIAHHLNVNMSSNNLLLKKNSTSLSGVNITDISSQQKPSISSSRSKRLLGLLGFPITTTTTKYDTSGVTAVTTDPDSGENRKDNVDMSSSKKKNGIDIDNNEIRQQQQNNNKDSKFHLKRTSSAQLRAQRNKAKGVTKRLSADETIVNPSEMGNNSVVATQNENKNLVSMTIHSNQTNDMKTKLVPSQTNGQTITNDKSHGIGNEMSMSSQNGPGVANELFKYLNDGSLSSLLFRPVEVVEERENGNDMTIIDPKTDYVLHNNNTEPQAFFLSSLTAALLPNSTTKDIEKVRNDVYNKHSFDLTTSLSSPLSPSANINRVNQEESNGIDSLTSYNHYYLYPNIYYHQQHLPNNKTTKANTNNHAIGNGSINSMSTTSNSSSLTSSTNVNHLNVFSTSPIIKQHNTNDTMHKIVEQGTGGIKQNEEQEKEEKEKADDDEESMSVIPIKKSVLTLNNALTISNSTNSRQKKAVNAALIGWKIKSSSFDGQQHDTHNESSIKSLPIMFNNSSLNENNEKGNKGMTIEPGIVLSDTVQAFWHPPVAANEDEKHKNELIEQCLPENTNYSKDDLIATTSFVNENVTTSAPFQTTIISSSVSTNNVNNGWSSSSNGSHNDWTDQNNHHSNINLTNDNSFDGTEHSYININSNDDFVNNNTKTCSKSKDNHQEDGDGHSCMKSQTKEASLNTATVYEKNRVNRIAQSFSNGYTANNFRNGFVINRSFSSKSNSPSLEGINNNTDEEQQYKERLREKSRSIKQTLLDNHNLLTSQHPPPSNNMNKFSNYYVQSNDDRILYDNTSKNSQSNNNYYLVRSLSKDALDDTTNSYDYKNTYNDYDNTTSYSQLLSPLSTTRSIPVSHFSTSFSPNAHVTITDFPSASLTTSDIEHYPSQQKQSSIYIKRPKSASTVTAYRQPVIVTSRTTLHTDNNNEKQLKVHQKDDCCSSSSDKTMTMKHSISMPSNKMMNISINNENHENHISPGVISSNSTSLSLASPTNSTIVYYAKTRKPSPPPPPPITTTTSTSSNDNHHQSSIERVPSDFQLKRQFFENRIYAEYNTTTATTATTNSNTNNNNCNSLLSPSNSISPVSSSLSSSSSLSNKNSSPTTTNTNGTTRTLLVNTGQVYENNNNTFVNGNGTHSNKKKLDNQALNDASKQLSNQRNVSRRSWNDLSSQQQSVRSTVQQSDNKIIDAFSNNDESPNTMNLNGDALSFGTTPPLPPPVLRKPIRIVKTVNSTTTTTTTSSSNNNNKNWNTDLLTTSMISDSKLQHQQNGNQNLNLLKTTTTSRPLAVSKTYSLAKTGLFSATPFNTSSMTSKLNENYHKTTNGMPETTNANNINDDTPKLNVDMKQQHGKNDNKEILSSSSNHVHTPLRRYKSREEYEFETNLKAYASRHPNNKQLYNLALSPTDHRLSTDYTRNLFPMPDRMRRLRSRFNSGERLDSISIQSYSPDYLQRTVFSDSIDSSNIQAEELILSLQRRLQTLKENRREITNETEENILLGNRLIGIVEKSAQASEVEKFKLHINEIDTITNLLLKLSSRLAKVENDIQCLQENIDERTKNCLIERRDEMQLKYDEARTLKDGIDRRSRLVCDILRKYLNDEQYADYDYYIKMKSTLHMDLKDIEEQIQLIEKQIQLLNLSLTIKTSPLTPSLVFEGVSDSLTSSTSPPTTTNMLPTYFKTISTSA